MELLNIDKNINARVRELQDTAFLKYSSITQNVIVEQIANAKYLGKRDCVVKSLGNGSDLNSKELRERIINYVYEIMYEGEETEGPRPYEIKCEQMASSPFRWNIVIRW